MPADPDTLLLATRSNDKLREIRQILAPVFRGRIISLADAGIQPTAEEDGIECFDTFADNARAKAAWFMRATGMTTVADDSGISVDALGGAPGVRSRRYAPLPADDDDASQDAVNNQRLLEALRDVPPHARTAHYTCAAVLLMPDGRSITCLGTCTGSILQGPRGAGGFGYDPLFHDPELNTAFAELPPATKNRRSHRARAFRALAANIPSP